MSYNTKKAFCMPERKDRKDRKRQADRHSGILGSTVQSHSTSTSTPLVHRNGQASYPSKEMEQPIIAAITEIEFQLFSYVPMVDFISSIQLVVREIVSFPVE